MSSRKLMPSLANAKNAAICLRELDRPDEALELYEELLVRVVRVVRVMRHFARLVR